METEEPRLEIDEQEEEDYHLMDWGSIPRRRWLTLLLILGVVLWVIADGIRTWILVYQIQGGNQGQRIADLILAAYPARQKSKSV